MNRIAASCLAFVALTLVGCATSNNVVVNPGAHAPVTSAYVVAHGDNSADMDASIQRALMARGIRVAAGPDGQATDTDVLVRYADNWQWDMVMYLRALDIQVYDAKSGTLLGSGAWKNSALHGYHDRDKVVTNVVDELLTKLRAPAQ
jgi:hypothetical protein